MNNPIIRFLTVWLPVVARIATESENTSDRIRQRHQTSYALTKYFACLIAFQCVGTYVKQSQNYEIRYVGNV